MTELTIKVEVTGLEGLVQAIMALAGRTAETGSAASAVPQNTVPVQQPFQGTVTPQPTQSTNCFQPQNSMPVQSTVPTTPVQPIQSGGVLPNGVPAGGIPTTAMPQEFTQDQIAVAAAGLVNQGKQGKLLELLHSFGANSIVELPKERYGEFATALRAEGAVI